MLIEGSDYPPATSPLIIAQTYGETDFSSAITVSLLQTLLGVLCVHRDGGGALGVAFSCRPPPEPPNQKLIHSGRAAEWTL